MATIAIADSRERHATAAAGLAQTVVPLSPRQDVVRVFNVEPGLLADVDAKTADFLRQRVVVPKLWLDAGPWEPPLQDRRMRRSLGLLVLDGLVIRTVELHGRRCPELVGAGDLLRPWDDADASLSHATSWMALDRASVAVLDERFCTIAGRWPSIMAQLLTRSIQRSHALAVNLAIVHVRHADLRLHMLLWHLADRWGRVTPDGVHLPVRLTHEMLAELACMRRPTASSALNGLARRGEIARCDDGTWLLTGSPPSAIDDARHDGDVGGAARPRAQADVGPCAAG